MSGRRRRERCQTTARRQASRSTQVPSGTIRPVSSASEMNSPGPSRPRSGCCQRTSASRPTIVLAVDRHLGLEEDPELLALDRLADRVLVVQARQGALARELVEQHARARRRRPWPGTSRRRRRGSGRRDPGSDRGDRDADAGRGHGLAAAPGGTAVLNALSTRSATATASSSSKMSSHRITNSSPPNRASVSWRRREWPMRSATATSSSSPAPWPRLSLITLKRSRSRNSTATDALGAAAEALERELQVVQVQQPARQAGQRVAQQLVLVGAPGDDVRHAGGEHEAAVDHAHTQGCLHRLLVVAVDRGRREHAAQTVVDDRRSRSRPGTASSPGTGSGPRSSRRSGSAPRSSRSTGRRAPPSR